MVTFTALAKIYPNISAIQRYMYLGLAKFLSSKNFWLYSMCSLSPLSLTHIITHTYQIKQLGTVTTETNPS